VRTANWVPPRYVFKKNLKGWGLEFSSNSHCSHEVPIKFLLVPSIIHQNHNVLKQFPSNSSCPINNPSKSLCSHQVLKQFSSNSSVPINNPSKSFCSHQVLIKFLLFPSSSPQIPFVPINFLLFTTQPYINPHKVLNFGIKRFFFATWKLGS
jgi:hypothetical protein